MNPHLFILISDQSTEIVVNAVQAFADLYSEREFAQNITIVFDGNQTHSVSFDTIEDEHFMFAVNYLTYPETIKGRMSVLGYDTAKERLYFIPSEDDEHDNCYYTQSQGRVIKHGFDGKEEEIELGVNYEAPAYDFSRTTSVVNISAKKPNKTGILSWLFGSKG